MAEEIKGMTNGVRTVALNVRLKRTDPTHLPVVANYTNVRVAQGMAHVNFGFIEPSLLIAMGARARKGESVPQSMEGFLATRVVLPIDALLRLQQQLSQVLSALNGELPVAPES
jgi:hypothetical protein